MKTIIVATDFSKDAFNAATYALGMANVLNAELYLLHVYQLPVSYVDIAYTIELSDLEQLAEKEMKELRERLLTENNSTIKINTAIRLGTFFNELEDVCGMIQPYAVVMGCQGKTAAEHILLGSHAVYAMKHLEWPLITVPVGAGFSSLNKIGLACDFKDVANTIPAGEISTFVKDLNAELHVLNTGKEGEFESGVVFEAGVLRGMLQAVNPHYHFITNDNMEEGVLNFVDKYHIDLLIVLPKRHSLIDRLVHRSHTKRLVLHSHVPVLALHH